MRNAEDRPTPVEILEGWRGFWNLIIVALVVVVLGFVLSYHYAPNRPVTYRDIKLHFKYGSVGSDRENALPLAVMKVLPRVCPGHLPKEGPQDFTAFGFLREPGSQLPIGFSVRRSIFDRVGLNCAACHAGVVLEPKRDGGFEPKIHLGMPANTVDLQSYFEFLFNCAADDRFTADNILREMESDALVFDVDRLIFKSYVIPKVRDELLKLKAIFDRLATPYHVRWGPGRVDAFNPYKLTLFAAFYPDGIPAEESVGIVDLPSIWNQGVRDSAAMSLHWDGNNDSLHERDVSAAIGDGAMPGGVDEGSIAWIEEWLKKLEAPKFPFHIDSKRADRGRALYERYCYQCHDPKGDKVGRVTPLSEIGTDKSRLNSYTEKLAEMQRAIGFKHFKKTQGYANAPLDGIWARAPYLHNGSVPTMWHLLTPAERPACFYRGHPHYDPVLMGFDPKVRRDNNGRKSFEFCVGRIPGNSNEGHTGKQYGTELSDDEKRNLIEYLKTL